MEKSLYYSVPWSDITEPLLKYMILKADAIKVAGTKLHTLASRIEANPELIEMPVPNAQEKIDGLNNALEEVVILGTNQGIEIELKAV